MAASRNSFWIRIAQALIVCAIISCAGGVIRNIVQIGKLETHFVYIRAALKRIEEKLP